MPRILVVDDEAHIQHVVSLKLRHDGMDVVTASDGDEALALAIEQRPDAIVTDFQMPGLTGLELSAAIREHAELADVPVLMLTARGFGLTDEQLAEHRIAEVMTKPFSPREMLQRVRSLLERASSSTGDQTREQGQIA
ncbi:MAG: response regulator [Planctomycetota bacterium]